MNYPDAARAPQLAIAASLRRERRRTGMSLSELANRAGIAKSTLSQLESGNGNPSVETLWSLCVTLGIPFSRLLEEPRPPVTVIRAGEAPAVAAVRARYQAALLSADTASARRELYLIDAEPGPGRESDPHLPGTVEHVVIAAGRALAGLPGDASELGPGDYIRYPGDVPHLFQALEPATRAIMLSEYAS